MGNNESRKALICTVVPMQFTPILRYTIENDEESSKMRSHYHVWSTQLRYLLTFTIEDITCLFVINIRNH